MTFKCQGGFGPFPAWPPIAANSWTAGDAQVEMIRVLRVARRTAEGRTKKEILRCLKRYIAREIYPRLLSPASLGGR